MNDPTSFEISENTFKKINESKESMGFAKKTWDDWFNSILCISNVFLSNILILVSGEPFSIGCISYLVSLLSNISLIIFMMPPRIKLIVQKNIF